MTRQLSESTAAKIKALCKDGDNLMEVRDFEAAKQKYIDALYSLPEDIINWTAATWIYTALGDAHFRLGEFDEALNCFISAVQCPKGLGNPYIHLRLGQVNYELGNLDKAADELTRAYMGGDIDILLEDDPKYLEFLETKIIM